MLSYFAELGKTFTWEDDRPGLFGPATVRREPVGVVAAIVPWNVPQFTTMTKLPAALVAGCTVVLKPAPETPLDAYLLAELIEQADLPPGVVNIVPAGREAGEHLVSRAGVDKVAFTRSTTAGRRIGSICGQQLKRCIGSGHPDRPAGRQAAAGPGGGLHPGRAGRGCEGRDRRLPRL